MTQEITHVTVVPDGKTFKDYQRGDIGQPYAPYDDRWDIACPGCGVRSLVPSSRIIRHEDGTVSSTSPLHCHGSKMRQRYSIERNEVKWL